MEKNSIVEGKIWKSLILFVIPIALSNLLQQLFSAADQAVVGQFAGSNALAAVGANTSLVGLLVNVFSAISIGSNAMIARMVGANRRDKINDIVHTSVTFAVVSGIFLLILTQCIAYDVHVFLGTPEDVLDMAVTYLKIYALGFPFSLLYNFGAAILRSVGDTKRPMIALTSAGVLNVILNLIFVLGFGMGVSGVACATSISNVFSSMAVMIMLLREEGDLHLNLKRLRIDMESIKDILSIGGPAAIQSAVFSIANVCIQSGINSLGSEVMAGSVAGQNFEYLSYMGTSAFGQATTTFCGQNYGARKPKRCMQTIKLALIENIVFVFCLDMLFYIFRVPLVGIFTKDPAVAQWAYIRMLIVVVPHSMIALYEIVGAAMRSMGHSLVPALLTIVGCVGFRVTWMFTIFNTFHTFSGLLLVYPASWVLTSVLTIGYYFLKRKKIYSSVE